MIAANGKEILSIFRLRRPPNQSGRVGGPAKMSGRNQLESVCAMDRIGPVSKDAGDRLRGAVRPPCTQVDRREEEHREGRPSRGKGTKDERRETGLWESLDVLSP
jgi:hypothetical protein